MIAIEEYQKSFSAIVLGKALYISVQESPGCLLKGRFGISDVDASDFTFWTIVEALGIDYSDQQYFVVDFKLEKNCNYYFNKCY